MDIVKRVLITIRNYFKTADSLLLVLCAGATAFGIVMIYSATRTYANPDQYIRIQTIAALIGFVGYFLLSIVDVDIITDRWFLLLAFNLLFTSTTLVWGEGSATGGNGWLRFGDGSIGIQPTEIVKITYILLLAKHMAYLREGSGREINSALSVGALTLHFAMIFGLVIIAADDLGSAMVFAVIFIVMLFAAGLRLLWFALGAAVLGAASPFIWQYALRDYHRNRIIAVFNPRAVDETGRGITWQVTQSKIALGSGQLTGQGYLQGVQSQSSNIPIKHSDFIFAIIGEELGLLGCLAVIVLLLLIIARCVYVGVRSRDRMKMLYCVGVAGMLTFQMFENIGMCIGIMPVIGITLPFFSYGGSSILSSIAACGIVSSIRRSSA
ncbi:MAG: FtsW/RodA/SpoVE family cell cycle protein [Oscillospiraceae bacterium]|jgi:rod shape determining protein RodA|nr:FtsW/RodA/SpoVE family cell cycle protein [Oscillospiraceae bacterium]